MLKYGHILQWKHCKVLLALFLMLCFSNVTLVHGNNCVSTGTGDWEDDVTWFTGSVPVAGDTVTIRLSDTVSINSNISLVGSPNIVLVYGTLNFHNAGSKLSLDCGSEVWIYGSLTTTGTGGGSSQSLKICGTTYWQRSNGNVHGFQVFPGALSVEYLTIDVHTKDDHIEIAWTTASEINNEEFIIERSKDGKHWKSIGSAAGAGNSSVITSYFEIDYKPIAGLSYYRLKQLDTDGTFTYSEVKPVKYVRNAETGINLFPNPVRRGEQVKVNLQSGTNEEVVVVLRDMAGNTYYSKITIRQQENQLIGIPIETQIPKGTYIITATSNDAIYSQQLIIL